MLAKVYLYIGVFIFRENRSQHFKNMNCGLNFYICYVLVRDCSICLHLPDAATSGGSQLGNLLAGTQIIKGKTGFQTMITQMLKYIIFLLQQYKEPIFQVRIGSNLRCHGQNLAVQYGT